MKNLIAQFSYHCGTLTNRAAEMQFYPYHYTGFPEYLSMAVGDIYTSTSFVIENAGVYGLYIRSLNYPDGGIAKFEIVNKATNLVIADLGNYDFYRTSLIMDGTKIGAFTALDPAMAFIRVTVTGHRAGSIGYKTMITEFSIYRER
jgi:hypothetical protein